MSGMSRGGKSALLLRKRLQKLREVVLPNHWLRMSSVATGLISYRQQDEPRIFHAFHQRLYDLEFRRIHEIVRRVDREYARRDLLEVRRRIVRARRVELVPDIVRV